jgi:hypothetical protein
MCGQSEEVYSPNMHDPVDEPTCQACHCFMRRDFKAEQGHMRQGELPDWVSSNAGVMPADVERANRHYANMGVTFDRRGNAHVPGNARKAFLKERGMVEL